MCERNCDGQYPSCISALLDGPGCEDAGFCEPCAVQIRARWKEMNLQNQVLTVEVTNLETANKVAERLNQELRNALTWIKNNHREHLNYGVVPCPTCEMAVKTLALKRLCEEEMGGLQCHLDYGHKEQHRADGVARILRW